MVSNFFDAFLPCAFLKPSNSAFQNNTKTRVVLFLYYAFLFFSNTAYFIAILYCGALLEKTVVETTANFATENYILRKLFSMKWDAKSSLLKLTFLAQWRSKF